jgi:exopolysaccharide biosynthesis polyprenyl glycosylphosphotransferase
MVERYRRIYPFYFMTDLVFMALSFYLPYILRYNLSGSAALGLQFPQLKQYSFIFALWAVFNFIFLNSRNLYTTDRILTIPKEATRVFTSLVYSSILISAVIFFAQYKFFSRLIFSANLILLFCLLVGWRAIKRIILRRMIERGFHNINVLIVGAGRMGEAMLAETKRHPWLGFKVVGFLDDYKYGSIEGAPIVGAIGDFNAAVKKYFVDEVIVTIPSEKRAVSEMIRQARNQRLGVKIMPENFEEPLPILDVDYLGLIPLLTYKERRHHPAEYAIKRGLDFVISLILLIIFSPALFTVALLIVLDSGLPVFYIQKRVGRKARIFNFYKFRSMVKDADQMKSDLIEKNEVKGGIIFKIRQDPRITRLGRILRKFSLDELPQLINVVKGDMSLIGPRPPTADEVVRYNHLHMERLSIKPGITGLAQVRGRSELTFRKWVKWDLWYVNNWSFGLDLRILWWTIPAVLKGKGAY